MQNFELAMRNFSFNLDSTFYSPSLVLLDCPEGIKPPGLIPNGLLDLAYVILLLAAFIFSEVNFPLTLINLPLV